MIVESKISSVTVFADRALVNRLAKTSLKNGINKIYFSELPSALIDKSVQIQGVGDAVLKDISIEYIYEEENLPQERNQFIRQRDEINDQLKALTDQVNQYNKEKALLDNIAHKLTNAEDKQTGYTTQNWEQFVGFYSNNQNSIDDKLRELDKKIKILNEKLVFVNTQIQETDDVKIKEYKKLAVVLEAEKDVEVALKLSYMIIGPSWYPAYDLRVSSETKELNLEYHANIQQDTGEDWNDITLKLSTAKPQISGVKPELSPWYVSVYKPINYEVEEELSSFDDRKRSMKKKAMSGALKNDFNEDDLVKAPKKKEIKKPKTTVESGATAFTFVIGAKADIKSDDKPHKYSVMRQTFNADFTYSSVPKLSEYAYLTAQIKNESEFAFLKGEANIFLDNNFITTTRLKMIAPNEKFKISLGIDESIRIKYKQVNKYEKDEGVFSKKRKIIYEFETKIHNIKKTEEKLIIQDQIPLSTIQQIHVELIEPKIKEKDENPKINNENKIEWKLNLKPDEEQIIYLKFSVECARDIEIEGVDM